MNEPLDTGETRRCRGCKQVFPVGSRDQLMAYEASLSRTQCEQCGKPLTIERREDGSYSYRCSEHTHEWVYGTATYCPRCHYERRKNNRQVYPLCPMCKTPTRVYDFLRTYQGYRLDIIRVCCTQCEPQFFALSEEEQLAWLRAAMVKAYGETGIIYAIQHDDTFLYQHIGRTKDLKQRLRGYKQKWPRAIKDVHILEEVPFGGLAIEREARWIFHAVKHGWPIDNFQMFSPERQALLAERTFSYEVPILENWPEAHRKEQAREEALRTALTDVEPLLAPFEVLASLLEMAGLSNTRDAHIGHWFVTHLMRSASTSS